VDARLSRNSVHQYGAGATDALSAAILGARQADEIAYHPQQGHCRVVHSNVVILTVHVERVIGRHGTSSFQGSVLGFKGTSPEQNETTLSRLLQALNSKKSKKAAKLKSTYIDSCSPLI
jgi:hypothetical protein